MLPRLHITTDDDVLALPSFAASAATLLDTHGRDVVLQLRGHATPAAQLYALAQELAAAALRSGAWLLVNDRIDVAMAARTNGVQLGRRSMSIADARLLVGHAQIGYSAHSAQEAAQAAAEGADFALLGSIYETASHEGRRPAGLAALHAARTVTVPIVAIGGITAARVAEVAAAGAYGVAVLGGVWRAADAMRAAGEYIEAVRAAWPRADEVA